MGSSDRRNCIWAEVLRFSHALDTGVSFVMFLFARCAGYFYVLGIFVMVLFASSGFLISFIPALLLESGVKGR